MKFYGRNQEVAELLKLDAQTENTSVFTLLTGRRRTGKTTLLQHTFGEDMLYLFVANKSERILCKEWQQAAETKYGLHFYGQINRAADLLKELMIYSQTHRLTLVIDEFQRLYEIDSSIMSEIQNVWDMYHTTAHIHLIACGSVYSMMQRIFKNKKEPLFGRATAEIRLRPFNVGLLKEILYDYNKAYTAEDLLALYAITGGVAKYVAQLMNSGATTLEKMLQTICNVGSVFIEEGTELLVGEFGRRYQTYYSILQLIANGMTTQSQIDSVIGRNTGRYLTTLEDEYMVIRKVRPMFAKQNSQGVKYAIDDNFLMFWFRFIESNRSLVEVGNYSLLYEIINDGYVQFSGLMLERYFRQLYREKPRVTEVGNWWDRKSENEIDMIAIERYDKRVTIAEIKRQKRKIDIDILKQKFANIKPYFRGYEVSFEALSLDDM